MALLRFVSDSVSSAPVVSIRLVPFRHMMPFSILFMAKNSRLGFSKYSLSANIVLMGSFVRVTFRL